MERDQIDAQIDAVPERTDRYRRLCVDGLRQSFDPVGRLWNRQLRAGEWASTLGTEDLTSTCICLIGVDRASVDPAALGVEPAAALAAAASRLVEHGYDGGLGLLLWAGALHGGADADGEALLRRVGRDLPDVAAYAARLTSMEVAWLLSGLLHEHKRRPDGRSRERAARVLAELQNRFDEGGVPVMPHAGAGASLTHRLRRRVANFADQIYPVQAFAFAAIELDSAAAFDRAKALAARMIELQGPLGQWWWHYDAQTGHVAARYPVYSVHQHAMAPMALMALRRAAELRGETVDVTGPIEASHGWLADNELGIDLVDARAGTIWRDVEYADGRLRGRLRHARALLGRHEPTGPVPLRLNRETRPYEWAWCLYADAIARGTDAGHHIV